MNNTLNLFKDYIKFRINSVNAHGLHSPFIYNLATRCLYDKTKYEDYQLLKKYQNQLLKNTEIITVTDLGAGSRKLKNNKRQVKDIAKVAGSSFYDMKLYYRLAAYFKPLSILELGTSLGKATFSFSLGAPEADIISVEGDPNIARIAKQLLTQNNRFNVKIINSDFDTYLQSLNKKSNKFDLILMDGNHRLQPTISYFEKLLPYIHQNSVVIIDDIYWSQEMKKAWDILKIHPSVYQTVDVFHFGMLFFRKQQFKQDFKINLHTLNWF